MLVRNIFSGIDIRLYEYRLIVFKKDHYKGNL